jgi:hypothetical protein
VIIWFLLAGLLIGGSWIVYSTGVMENKQAPVAKQQAAAKPATVNEATKTTISSQKEIIKTTPLLQQSAPVVTPAPKAQHRPVASADFLASNPATNKPANPKETGIAMENKPAEKQGNDEASEEDKNEISDKADSKDESKNNDKAGNNISSPSSKSNNKSNKNNWQWGINAGAGISDLGMQLFKSTSVVDFAYSNNGGMATPGTPTSVGKPSEINAGAAFQLGGYVSKGISKKLALKLGLNYEYYSNTISVGTHYNAPRAVNQGPMLNMVDQYYAAGTESKFTNKYHFVSLPLSLQWKINKNQKHGIVWENGVNLARMVAVNALHYDGISGTYYKDNDLFNKTQWIASSSLLFSIKTKNKVQLYAGPQLQYGISNIVDESSGNNNHLRYAGLKIMAGFNKK